MSRIEKRTHAPRSIFWAILLIGMMLSGCPVGSDFPLGEPGKEAIDKSLVGTWTTDNDDAEIRKVSILKRDDFSYEVEVLERGEMYGVESSNFTGYVTELEGKNFVYFFDEAESKYYLYEYSISDDNALLTTHDVGLLEKGVDGIQDTKSYREEVSKSLKKEDCLTSEIVWEKE